MNQDNQLHLLPFQESTLLKELGFDWPCHYAHISENRPPFMPITPDNFNDRTKFDTGFSAPTHDHACKWLRDVHGVNITVDSTYNNDYDGIWYWGAVYVPYNWDDEGNEYAGPFNTYEEAQLQSIKDAIKWLQKNIAK